MRYFIENTPFSQFERDCEEDILIESIDDDNFPPATSDDDWEEDFPNLIDDDWSWLM